VLDNLPDDVREELSDPKYWGRKHYSRATYASGCRGPLCRKSERDRGRYRNADAAYEAGRIYVPDHHRRVDEEKLIEALVWYLRTIRPKAKAS
jgi:hypothetical protein